MRFLAAAVLAVRAATAAPCAGEFSLCPNGQTCALVTATECKTAVCTGATRYVCPLSSGEACFDGVDFLASCPGLKGTHFDSTLTVEARLDAMFAQPWTTEETIGQLTDNASSIPRLSIPPYSWLNDDQHGVKQPDATAFPNGASLGASWDTALLTQVGLAIGTEARGVHSTLEDKSGETGGHSWPGTIRNGVGLTLYAPNVNLVHDPRWGRANEVMSECPALTGSLVAAYVSGLQNNSASGPLLTVACCKHYAIYNVETIPTIRTEFNAVVGARDLWETYMPVFEQCVGQGPGQGHGQSVMCSYNSVNGIPTCGSKGLLTDALRTTMGFDGFVMSDYDAWANIVDTHHYVSTYAEAATVGLNAGLDQEGGGGPTYPPVQTGIPLALAAGNVTAAQLETAARRLMRARLRLGMFDGPASNPYNAINASVLASPAHLALAELAARKGMTLLKNANGALPLRVGALGPGGQVALLGPNANASYIMLGSYSDPGCCSAGIPTLLQELTPRLGGAAHLAYAPGCATANCADDSGFAAAVAAAGDPATKAVVLALGMGNAQYACGGAADKADCEAEDYDRTTCALPGGQPALVAAVKAALAPGVPLIGVLVHGGAFCLDAATLGAFDGLLDAWYPGMRGGAAMADALVGAFSPAGRSPVTWYASDAALPADRGAMSPYPVPGVSPGITYRFYAPEAASPPLPPPVFTFGEGLSYTTFSVVSVAAAATAAPCDAIPLSVTLANTGAMDSEVVVQVFLAQPSLAGPAPRTRLATFARAFVRAGGRATVALPPVAPSFRARVTNDASGEDIYTLPGKRFADPGQLRFRVCLGEHNCHLQGGYAFNVTQAGPSTDLSTCGK